MNGPTEDHESAPVPIGALGRWLLPSLHSYCVIGIFVLLVRESWRFLVDSDTGWHIRTGDWIRQTGAVPRVDLFSYTMPGRPWFAWEWLSDLLMAAVHRTYGLAGVVAAAIVVLLVAFAVLDRVIVSRGSSALLAFVLTSFAAAITLIHWLARPHLLSILLMVVWCSIVEDYRRHGSRWIVVTPLLVALWANLHGAFVVVFPMLAVYALGEWIELRSQARRPSKDVHAVLRTYAWVAALSALATLATPYGIALHGHLFGYLSDDRLLEAILEFQSPNFHEIEGKTLEVLMLLAVAAAFNAMRGRRYVEAGMVVLWTHMALQSRRHMALAAVVLMPIIAEQWSALAREAGDRLASASTRSSGRWRSLRARYRGFLAVDRQLHGIVVYPGILLFLIAASTPGAWPHGLVPRNFDPAKYPVAASDFIADKLPEGRIYAPDQYGSYLIYRFYPRLEVFADGRSDFYRQGPVLADMLTLSLLKPTWRDVLDRYGVRWMVLQRGEPLALAAALTGEWSSLYRDDTAEIIVRRSPPVDEKTSDVGATGDRTARSPSSIEVVAAREAAAFDNENSSTALTIQSSSAGTTVRSGTKFNVENSATPMPSSDSDGTGPAEKTRTSMTTTRRSS